MAQDPEGKGEGVRETFVKPCSPVISGVYQTTAVLPFPGGSFLSHPHSWGRNHLSVPNIAGRLLSASLCQAGRGPALQKAHGYLLSPLCSRRP